MFVNLIDEKSIVVPSPVTGLPGTNFRLDGFGVGIDLMNNDLNDTDAAIK